MPIKFLQFEIISKLTLPNNPPAYTGYEELCLATTYEPLVVIPLIKGSSLVLEDKSVKSIPAKAPT